MSSKHLTKGKYCGSMYYFFIIHVLIVILGSVEPPRNEGLLRLYSMEFCPYAHRSRLVLKAKGIPHDIVNINLIQKPEWYFSIHPEGKKL